MNWPLPEPGGHFGGRHRTRYRVARGAGLHWGSSDGRIRRCGDGSPEVWVADVFPVAAREEWFRPGVERVRGDIRAARGDMGLHAGTVLLSFPSP